MYETIEEVNLHIELDKLIGVSNQIIPSEQVHYVAPTFLAKSYTGELKNNEPTKLKDVRWFSLDNLPKNLTSTTISTLHHFLQKN